LLEEQPKLYIDIVAANQAIVSAATLREVRLNVWVLDSATPTSFSRYVSKRGAEQRGENQSQIRPNINVVLPVRVFSGMFVRNSFFVE
jgi:hypothetical protein